MKIVAENKELILQNTAGDTIIIPRTHREKVLKHIEEGNYKAIDDIAEGLPFMEDYADEGSLITEGIDPPKVTTSQNNVFAGIKRGPTTLDMPKVNNKLQPILDSPYIDEFGNEEITIPKSIVKNKKDTFATIDKWNQAGEEWANNQLRNEEGKFVDEAGNEIKYEANPYPYSQGCGGSACRAGDKLMPDLPSYYSLRDKHLGNMSVRTGKSGEGGNKDFSGLDSWEFSMAATKKGFGKLLMEPSKGITDYISDPKRKSTGNYSDDEETSFETDMQKIRGDLSSKWDDVPAGTIFNMGNADIGNTYTNKGDKVRVEYKDKKGKAVTEDLGEAKFRTRHTTRSVGIDENGDHIIYDYGQYYTVGNSGKADKTPDQWMTDERVMYAVALDEKGNWSKNKIERAQKHNRALQSLKEKK